MKILLIHNRYQYRGGEDVVFELESELLKKRGENVDTLIFNNDVIQSNLDKVKIGLYSFYNPQTSSLLEKKINEFSPDVIHVHNFFPIASPSLFYISSQKKIPVVMTLHNYRLICPNAVFFREGRVCDNCISKSFAIDGVVHGCYRNSKVQTLLLASMTYYHKVSGTWKNKVSKYIALTSFSKNKFLYSSLNLKDTQLIVKPNFVEDHGFDFNKEEYFIFIGRLSNEKGIDVLLDAFKGTSKKLVVIGDGPLRNIVQKCVSLNKNIKYLGCQSKEVILLKLKKAKALLFTSICYESFGMTIIEAFSCATPVISSDIGAPNELVDGGVTGLKFKVGKYEELKKKMMLLDKDKSLHYQLCLNARKEYEDKYTEENNYKQLTSIYKDAIDEKKKSY